MVVESRPPMVLAGSMEGTLQNEYTHMTTVVVPHCLIFSGTLCEYTPWTLGELSSSPLDLGTRNQHRACSGSPIDQIGPAGIYAFVRVAS